MKTLSLLLAIVLLTSAGIAQTQTSPDHGKFSWYVSGGSYFWSEDVETGVGDGAGVNFGVGVQINETFGLELHFNQSPAIDPNVLTNAVIDELDLNEDRVSSWETETHGVAYSSLLGTARFPIDNQRYMFLKAGVASYLVQFHIEIEHEIPSLWGSISDDYEFDVNETGSTPVISLGIEVPMGKGRPKGSIELAVAQYFKEEVAATSIGIALKYTF